MLVLTDEELVCISAAEGAAWPVPLGAAPSGVAFAEAARAGERSLAARGLLGRGTEVPSACPTRYGHFVRPGLTQAPPRVMFVADSSSNWVLAGPTIIVHAGVPSRLEVRNSAGLHHFLLPPPDGLVAGVETYIRAAHDTGFPQTEQVGVALCVVLQPRGLLFRVEKGRVLAGRHDERGIQHTEWVPSDIERVVALASSV